MHSGGTNHPPPSHSMVNFHIHSDWFPRLSQAHEDSWKNLLSPQNSFVCSRVSFHSSPKYKEGISSTWACFLRKSLVWTFLSSSFLDWTLLPSQSLIIWTKCSISKQLPNNRLPVLNYTFKVFLRTLCQWFPNRLCKATDIIFPS